MGGLAALLVLMGVCVAAIGSAGSNQTASRTVHLVISLAKRWLLGTHQGAVEDAHLAGYLDEFVFRFNRRRSRSRGLVFHRVLQLAVSHYPVRYRDLIVERRPRVVPPIPPARRGHPPSLERRAAGRPRGARRPLTPSSSPPVTIFTSPRLGSALPLSTLCYGWPLLEAESHSPLDCSPPGQTRPGAAPGRRDFLLRSFRSMSHLLRPSGMTAAPHWE